MLITPISGMTPLIGQINQTVGQANSGGETVFADLLQNAVDQVNATDQVSKQDAIKIAAGDTDNLHTIMINAEKADLALQLMVQVRNKALDAYNEIMRITL